MTSNIIAAPRVEDFALDAASLALACRRPVQVQLLPVRAFLAR